MKPIQNPVYYRKFRHNRHIHILFRHVPPYCDIFRTLYCVTLAYSAPCHIQHPAIFRTQSVNNININNNNCLLKFNLTYNFFDVFISTPKTSQKPLSACFMAMLQSSTIYLKASHSSLDM